MHFKLLTYNVHRCIGADGRRDPDRSVRVLRGANVDMALLQEVDARDQVVDATGKHDQPEYIAHALGMKDHFVATRVRTEDAYGHALLTRMPVLRRRYQMLPALGTREPRIAALYELELGTRVLRLIHVHLSVNRRERVQQATRLMRHDWLERPDANDGGPLILCGDLNATPGSDTYRMIASRLRDVQLARGRPRMTWHSLIPVVRIDHIFHNRALQVAHVEVVATRTARLASDHLPLLACFSYEEAGRQ